jgi:hypothetical protein
MALSPLDKQIVLGVACGALERSESLDTLRLKLERQRAPKADIRLLLEAVAHLNTIYNNLQDVARRMEGCWRICSSCARSAGTPRLEPAQAARSCRVTAPAGAHSAPARTLALEVGDAGRKRQ